MRVNSADDQQMSTVSIKLEKKKHQICKNITPLPILSSNDSVFFNNENDAQLPTTSSADCLIDVNQALLPSHSIQHLHIRSTSKIDKKVH
jgi:hypothetical protein